MKRIVVTAITFALLALPAAATSVSAGPPKCAGIPATIVGNDKANYIKGTPGRDVIVAKGGRDKILGLGGNDIICAGNGNDVVLGGDGRDRIFGNAGKDILKGDGGFDKLFGGKDKDACYGGADGALKSGCEGADLKVIVRASTSSVVGQAGPEPMFDITWRVKNIGPKDAAGVKVDITWDETGVTCRGADDPTGVEVLGTLESGEFEATSYLQDCGLPIGDEGTVSLKVTASTTSPEAIKSNNAGAAEVIVTRP